MEDNRVIILMYHNIGQDNSDYIKSPIENRPYILKKSQFEEQMDYLFSNGYKTISMEEFISRRNSRETIPGKSIIITFDDGHISNYTQAFPILKKYGFSAIFFVVVGRIGMSANLTWDNIKEMMNNGMEIGSHTLTHPRPSQLPAVKLQYELKESKRLLEQHLKKDVKFLSSPTGYYNKAIKQIAKNVGYKAVCASRLGANPIDADLFFLKRIPIKANYDFKSFNSLVNLENKTLLFHKSGDFLRAQMRNLLGMKIYEFLRRRILTISNGYRGS